MIRSLVKLLLTRGQLAWPLAAVFLTACGREEVQTYRVPKEAQPAPPAAPAQAPAAPRLSWRLPPGWEQVQAGEMRLASFTVKGQSNQQADVSIIPLPGHAGGDLANVNRWRGQVGLPAVTEEELAKLAESVEVNGQPARLFDQGGQNASEQERTRILAVIFRHEEVAWFFKMTGSDALVVQQKPLFVEFLKSMRFQAAEAQPALPPSHPPIGDPGASAPSAPAGGAKPNWKVPAGWQETAPGQMQLAKFLVSGEGGAKAETSVAVIPGDGGGALANVNRWRRQIGLGPIEAGELPKQTTTLEVGTAQAMVLDVTSEDRKKRLLVASVPRDGSTWFYKLLGDEALVAREKAAFLQFVQSAK